ncbi:hypothetical protein CEXT_411951 [Caerostris extrusa]|uniref:Uncharacterized protein n=1 Tax=Caerostris extrusa TaxID=172846 RepID=A0AAV4UIA3_CAEEX|nr:hypothetical protein CEXT_411951 [Caerostris extrusa]
MWFTEADVMSSSICLQALVIDTKANLSPSKERCLISGGLKNYLIPDQHSIASSNLSPESLPNHHLALHGDTFPEKPCLTSL